jgi:Flp pilus assembly protein TadG
MKAYFRKQKTSGSKAQAIVEFAIVLPILMMILVGIFEVGRLLFIYTAVTNASREAARFGSALGYDDAGNHKYKDCAGIRNMARKSAYFLNLTDANITIQYDQGPSNLTPFASCTAPSGEDSSVLLHTGNADPDRVVITITASYSPLIRLIPISSRTITSKSARTILGYVEIGSSSGGGGGPNTATSAPGTPGTAVPSSTSTATATATVPSNTPTKTATSGPIATFTPLPSSTPTLIPSSTPTATFTATATSTSTPTGTSTPISSCSITTSDISMATNSSMISMTITNPYVDVTVSSIQLQWNAATGASGNKTLTLDSANLTSAYGTTIWSSLNNSLGTATLTPASTLTLPGNNRTSTITFTLAKNYQNPITNGTTITINLSTPGCNAITKTK